MHWRWRQLFLTTERCAQETRGTDDTIMNLKWIRLTGGIRWTPRDPCLVWAGQGGPSFTLSTPGICPWYPGRRSAPVHPHRTRRQRSAISLRTTSAEQLQVWPAASGNKIIFPCIFNLSNGPLNVSKQHYILQVYWIICSKGTIVDGYNKLQTSSNVLQGLHKLLNTHMKNQVSRSTSCREKLSETEIGMNFCLYKYTKRWNSVKHGKVSVIGVHHNCSHDCLRLLELWSSVRKVYIKHLKLNNNVGNVAGQQLFH